MMQFVVHTRKSRPPFLIRPGPRVRTLSRFLYLLFACGFFDPVSISAWRIFRVHHAFDYRSVCLQRIGVNFWGGKFALRTASWYPQQRRLGSSSANPRATTITGGGHLVCPCTNTGLSTSNHLRLAPSERLNPHHALTHLDILLSPPTIHGHHRQHYNNNSQGLSLPLSSSPEVTNSWINNIPIFIGFIFIYVYIIFSLVLNVFWMFFFYLFCFVFVYIG